MEDRTVRGPGGRKRDDSLDDTILKASLDVLVEIGPSGITMDAVAAHAGVSKATIYRRWLSKEDLIVDAVAYLKRQHDGLKNLPDSGTLRGDLLGLFRPRSAEETERQMRILTAMSMLLAQEGRLADAANSAVVEPWADAVTTLMLRAVSRGEVPASADVETLARVIPSLAAYRILVQRQPFTFEFLRTMVDTVVLPALGIKADAQNLADKEGPVNQST